MQDAEEYEFTLNILKKRLKKINKESELGGYLLKRVKNLFSLILEIVTEINIFVETKNTPVSETISDPNYLLISELENNYQSFKLNEIEVIKKYVDRTTIDEKVNALEVADSHFDDLKISHSMILGQSMIRTLNNPNVKYFLKIFLKK